ncbi:MAG: hypothetical protein P1S60_09170, partial [Anaerolineae bacterium]|nr:hypothetical protein [Anaerolineae bacterium]
MFRSKNNGLWLLPLLMLLGLLTACLPTVTAVPGTATPVDGGASTNVSLVTWQREGGIAGFCDGLLIYQDSRVVLTTCEGEEVGEGKLSAAQREQLQAWVDQLAAFEVKWADPAVADAMTVRLTFTGKGITTASDTDQQKVSAFASQVYASLTPGDNGTPPPEVEIEPDTDKGRAYAAALDELTALLGVDAAAIQLLNITEADWSDSCLGLGQANELCLAVITPGYRVVVEVNGAPYVARTNADASQVRIEMPDAGQAIDCQDYFDVHPLLGSDEAGRTTLSQDGLARILDDMGLTSLCIPPAWGAPFLNVDWRAETVPGTQGVMLSLGFEAFYHGAGWSDIYVLYSSYDFATGSEYDRFASQEDWDALQQ